MNQQLPDDVAEWLADQAATDFASYIATLEQE